MDELIYSIKIDDHLVKLEKNNFGFCVDVDWGDRRTVYSHEDLQMAQKTFEGMVLMLGIKKANDGNLDIFLEE